MLSKTLELSEDLLLSDLSRHGYNLIFFMSATIKM